jgi:uncharacterized protein (DUF488 family)
LNTVRVLTIGFTQKSAERFFDLLASNAVQTLVDIRLHPDGQLAGFAKRADLPFFLRRLADCDYLHLPVLAPTEEILKDFRKDHDWGRYVERFEALMDERNVPEALDQALFERRDCCLLCSEATPEHCHRRLIVERLARVWPNVHIVHLT